jgi:hypothetical protein
MRPVTPALHVLWALVFALIFWKRNEARRVFAAIVAAGYVFHAAMPFAFVVWRMWAKTGGVVYTQDLGALKALIYRSGFGAAMCVLMALVWGLEALRPRNDYDTACLPQWRWWVMPFFLWALWWPLTPGFPYHEMIGAASTTVAGQFEGLLYSPFGLMAGPLTLALLCLLALCREANRLLVTAFSILAILLTRFAEPMWWVSIPIFPMAAYCLVLWNVPAIVRKWREKREPSAHEAEQGQPADS